MNPGYYSYPQSSGAAQMTGYQPAGPAAPASLGPTEEAFRDQVRGNPEETLAALVRQTGWRPEWIQRLVHLRATEDPRQPGARRHMPFELIREIMQGEFPTMGRRLDALQVGWDNTIRQAMQDRFRVKHRLPAARAAALAQGSYRAGQSSSVDPQGARPDASQHPQMSFQDVHQLSYRAHQPGPGAPVGRAHVGHHGQQYGAPQPGFGDPYQNTRGTNQQLPQIEFPNPPSGNVQDQLPRTASSAQLQRNQRPPPMEPPYQMPTHNYSNAASNSQAPQVGQWSISEQEAYDQAYPFSAQQRAWILDHGMYMGSEEGAEDEFYGAFRNAFGNHRLPSKDRVMGEFNQMRR
ncbi:hypothetical protein LA080_006176 [Diaporthe eres]|nr:hypothetical protein LA080_006176 [Diaporthe eres]